MLSLTQSLSKQFTDIEAFSELVRRNIGSCHRVALSILRNQAEAEDAVQTAMLNAFVHFGFQSRSELQVGCFSIVVNESLGCFFGRRNTLEAISPLHHQLTPTPALELRSTATLRRNLLSWRVGYIDRQSHSETAGDVSERVIALCLRGRTRGSYDF